MLRQCSLGSARKAAQETEFKTVPSFTYRATWTRFVKAGRLGRTPGPASTTLRSVRPLSARQRSSASRSPSAPPGATSLGSRSASRGTELSHARASGLRWEALVRVRPRVVACAAAFQCRHTLASLFQASTVLSSSYSWHCVTLKNMSLSSGSGRDAQSL